MSDLQGAITTGAFNARVGLGLGLGSDLPWRKTLARYKSAAAPAPAPEPEIYRPSRVSDLQGAIATGAFNARVGLGLGLGLGLGSAA